MATPYNKLINNLETVKLDKMREGLDSYITFINDGKKTVIEALYELTNLEMDLREKRAINACVRTANFPYIKTFQDFDFSYQPSIKKEQILDFQQLRFLEQKENIIFIGTPGVGKTHLSVSIGEAAARNRVSTYFINCNDLVLQLKRAHMENRLETRLKHFAKYKILIIDEVGFLPLDLESSNLFFQLIAKRYEKHSTILTTNKPLSKWGEIFGDPVLANAILDRVLHHSHVINITGRSYRIKDKLVMIEEEGDAIN
ncbi:IS21-like element helper ATPase IstB [Breznakia pachnodae]|uniref:DNA replication protein DnaC n=1 Tax=Breznakia pachnodae TaxID=265178 RepID=A0ABU0E4R6_9FIRM|nr:IS21-like element helper ATPase IstB [Breznakia pachnodae]MDQ0361870.1 DNA replication protein DnaC [Breznakia pachnodae]